MRDCDFSYAYRDGFVKNEAEQQKHHLIKEYNFHTPLFCFSLMRMLQLMQPL